MRNGRTFCLCLGLTLAFCPREHADAEHIPLPKPNDGWSIEIVEQAPRIVFPTAIVAAPDGTVYLGQDPMDMPGPPTEPIDSVVALKGKALTVFADRLWAVMGLEWVDGTLYVVHPPFLSALRDTDGDGKADQRTDLITGLGPKLPGFNGINDHVASGIRLGMDGFLYISVGDKGIPSGVGKDGTVITMFGGGVIRIRPDGTGLEVVSTGERNPLSVALSETDEIFTYGNDDDSKKWPNSLTHHIVGGHYGYPYQFLTAPERALPIVHGQMGGAGAQGVIYNEAGLPPDYQGNLFVCDWGLQTVFRYRLERVGGTFAMTSRTAFIRKGDEPGFRPFSLHPIPDGPGFYLVDWGFNGFLVDGPKTGRLYRVTYKGPNRPVPVALLATDSPAGLLAELEHPSHSTRLRAQRSIAAIGKRSSVALVAKLKEAGTSAGRRHALWALDSIDTPEAQAAVRNALCDTEPEIRLQAARRAGIRADRTATERLVSLLTDSNAAVRREAAIALGKVGDPGAVKPLMAALGDQDTFADWSIRHALRHMNVWDANVLTAALVDPKRRASAIKQCDEVWAAPVIEALISAIPAVQSAPDRAKLVTTLAGLYRKYPRWSGAWFGTNPLAGAFPQKTEAWDTTAMARVQAGLVAAADDSSPAVRLKAYAGLILVGGPAQPTLRAALVKETEVQNLEILVQGLGVLGDFMAAQPLGVIVRDPGKTAEVRASAIDALGQLRGPQAFNARLMLVYDPNAPAGLVARALPSLGRDGLLPPNDLAGFLENPAPEVRVAALRGLVSKKELPAEVTHSLVARLADKDVTVRRAAAESIGALRVRDAIPRLLGAALDESTRAEASAALANMPDAQALPVFFACLRDRNPQVRAAGERALLAIRDEVTVDLEKAAGSGQYDGPAAASLQRVMTRYRPVANWKVIGPFPRTTAGAFIGQKVIDFGKTHTGAEGLTIAWSARQGNPESGQVVIDDLKGGAGDRGGFGYDTNGSPDLCAFGSAEVYSPMDREAVLLIGSSGSVKVALNETIVHTYDDTAGRGYRPESDLVHVRLVKGKNRLLVVSRQGMGVWSFGVQVSEPLKVAIVASTGSEKKRFGVEYMRAFAMSHEGDPKGGEALFFDEKGVGCVKCHSVGDRGNSTVGPDLTGLALKYDRAEIIRSVLEPSSRIATGYQPTVIATRDGRVLQGVVRAETDALVELGDADAKLVRVAKADIEARRVGSVSIMPANLVEGVSPVEFADLISYLMSLRSAPAQTAARTGKPTGL